MSIQSLTASLELLDTTPGALSSFNTPPRTTYHRMAQDVMLIQGMHYAVEEALANVGELSLSDPPFDPHRRCILRLQQNLIDIARILENVQENVLHNITNHASTSQTSIVTEDQTPEQMTEPCGGAPLPITSVPERYRIEDSNEVVMFRPEPLPYRSDLENVAPSPSENLTPLHQASLGRRPKRKASDEDDNHITQLPPTKRPRRGPARSIYLRPTYQTRNERTSVFGWAKRMFSVLGQ